MTSLSPQFKNHVRTAANVGLAAGLAASVGVAGMTGQGAEGDYQNGLSATQNDQILNRPANTPTWDRALSQQFKGFRAMDQRPEDHIPSQVVAVHSNATAQRMPFDKAWDLNHDKERANNVWTVGYR